MLDKVFGKGTLHPLSRVIDDFEAGIATSRKSIDLNAATYQDFGRLSSRLNAYVDKLAEYTGTRWGGDVIESSDVTGRVLQVIIPKGSMSPVQRAAFEAARERARRAGVNLTIVEFQDLMMHFSLYLRNGIAFVPTTGRVLPGGAYRDMEPVTVAPLSNPEAVRRALRDAVSRGNPPAPRYPPGGHPLPVVVKYAGVKSWSAFARGTLPWGISERDGNFQILGYRRHPDGWREDPEQTVDLPAGSTADDAIDRMIAILQAAAQK